MASEIVFILNDKKVIYNGNPSVRLLDWLRDTQKLTGTKCGCKEGECGACAVIISGKLINSCLVAMGSLCGANVLTIEGYSTTARFAALDMAYASVSAVQCGFCIPGMIMASECLLAEKNYPTENDIRTAISGNICRCTGYNAIVKAIGLASAGVEYTAPPIRKKLEEYIDVKGLAPTSLDDALRLRKNKALIPYSGGTDIMVSGVCSQSDYFFINNVEEMCAITSDDNYIRFGAACSFTDAISNPLTPTILKQACKEIAAPAIRNAGTLGGNIANGSAKADAALIFMVTDSLLRLVSLDGERLLPIKDFYLGRGKTALADDELLVEILMPKYGLENYYYKKVGARNALAISRSSFAGIMDISDGLIANCAVAFGAICDVILRFPDIDSILTGKSIDEAKRLKESYIAAYNEAIVPRPGRVSVEYRKDICLNLLRDFLDSNGI